MRNGSPLYETLNESPSQEKLLSAESSSPGAGGSRPIIPDLKSEASSLKEGVEDEDEDESFIDEPTAGFGSCSINLLKSILGAGVLAMPSAFATLGYVLGTFFVLLAGISGAFGLHLFTICSQYVGRKATIGRIADITYPKFSLLFDFAIALKCFGVALSYLIVIGDMLPGIAQGFGLRHWVFLSRKFWLTLSMILLVPLAFLKKMDSLKYTSFAGLLSIVYLVMVAMWNYFKPTATHPPPNAGMEPIASISISSLKSFSILPIQKEASDNSSKFMNRVIFFCIFLATIIYFVFSIISYANFGQIVQGNIFKNYPSDKIEMIIARVLFAFLSAFSYPLQTLPCRMSIENLIPLSKTTKKTHSDKLHIILTALILFGTFVIAYLQDNLVLISGIIGTAAGIPICYVFPFAFYYKLTEGCGWTKKRLAAAGLAALGVLTMVFSGVSLVITILYPSSG